MTRIVRGCAGALALLALLAGCSRALASDDIERELERQLSTQGFVPDVSCDEDLPGDVGATITCSSTLADGVDVEIRVEVTEVDGDQVRYDYQVGDLDLGKTDAGTDEGS